MTLRRGAPWLLSLLAMWVALVAARYMLRITPGLTSEYFASEAPAGRPVFTALDREISVDQVSERWHGAPPAVFSIRWFGYISVRRGGTYTFALTSDDGSRLSIDGTVIVDNGGRHGPLTKAGTAELAAGPHAVLIEYVQLGGDYTIAWSWSRDRTALAPIPQWLLTTGRVPVWKVFAARGLEVSIGLTLAAALALVGFMLVAAASRMLQARRPDSFAAGRLSGRKVLASLGFFIALAAVETWPLASDPVHLSRNDNGDTMLNEWAIAWVAHQAPRAPLHLFDGNIFYPERNTLAYSETMIVQSAMAAPVLWLGGSPVLAYNLVLIAGFALTGWAMCLVLARWTGDWIAGVTSGILFAFNAHSFTRMPHLQAMHVEFLPAALLTLDALLRRPSARRALQLACWFSLQALASIYLLVFTAVALAVAALARPDDWFGKRIVDVAKFVALAAAIAGTLLLPFVLPYWRVYHDMGMTRTLGEAGLYAASWPDYLSTPGRFHYYWWSARWFVGSALFPGALGLALVAIAIARGVAITDPRPRMCLAFGICGVALSFGTKTPGYATLYQFVPLLHSIRAVSRFGYLGIVAVAMVAGFGVVELKRMISARAWRPVAVAIVAIAAFEPLAIPIEFTRFEGIPRIYSALRDQRDAVVVEVPFYGPPSVFAQAPYVLNSTRNWRPTLNGYSGFQPPSFYMHFEQLANFPDDASVAALRANGVSHVFVHTGALDAAALSLLARRPEFHRISTDHDIVLYKLDR